MCGALACTCLGGGAWIGLGFGITAGDLLPVKGLTPPGDRNPENPVAAIFSNPCLKYLFILNSYYMDIGFCEFNLGTAGIGALCTEPPWFVPTVAARGGFGVDVGALDAPPGRLPGLGRVDAIFGLNPRLNFAALFSNPCLK